MSDFSVEKVYHQNKSKFSIIFPFSEFSSSDPMDQTFLQIIPSIISRRKKMTGFNISWVQGINSEINNIAVDDKKVIEKIFVQLHREGKIFNQTYNNQRRLWFLRTGNMVTSSIEAVEKGEILFVPEKWKKIFYNLMQNTGNWCISRPTGRNHKIPAYYCNHCNTIMVEINIPGSCSNCSSPRIFRDENNFDPLFSSSIQTLIQLGWLDHSKTLSVRYPASITVTQRHTEFFWASRMIMIGLLLGKNIPFREVVIYGPIADTRSKKKQKSRIKVNHSKDPIDEYNTDPIRFSRAILSSQRQKILLSTDRIKCGKRFKNKLWNASRYVISNINGDED